MIQIDLLSKIIKYLDKKSSLVLLILLYDVLDYESDNIQYITLDSDVDYDFVHKLGMKLYPFLTSIKNVPNVTRNFLSKYPKLKKLECKINSKYEFNIKNLPNSIESLSILSNKQQYNFQLIEINYPTNLKFFRTNFEFKDNFPNALEELDCNFLHTTGDRLFRLNDTITKLTLRECRIDKEIKIPKNISELTLYFDFKKFIDPYQTTKFDIPYNLTKLKIYGKVNLPNILKLKFLKSLSLDINNLCVDKLDLSELGDLEYLEIIIYPYYTRSNPIIPDQIILPNNLEIYKTNLDILILRLQNVPTNLKKIIFLDEEANEFTNIVNISELNKIKKIVRSF